jgi:hypothetical protein
MYNSVCFCCHIWNQTLLVHCGLYCNKGRKEISNSINWYQYIHPCSYIVNEDMFISLDARKQNLNQFNTLWSVILSRTRIKLTSFYYPWWHLRQYHVQHYWSREVNYGDIHNYIGLYTWVSYVCIDTIINSQNSEYSFKKHLQNGIYLSTDLSWTGIVETLMKCTKMNNTDVSSGW